MEFLYGFLALVFLGFTVWVSHLSGSRQAEKARADSAESDARLLASEIRRREEVEKIDAKRDKALGTIDHDTLRSLGNDPDGDGLLRKNPDWNDHPGDEDDIPIV